MASEGGPADAFGEAGAATGGHALVPMPPKLRLTEEQIGLLRREGEVRRVAAGEVLFREGDRGYDFIVILAGRVAIVDHQAETERELAAGEPGQFVAELGLLTGERLFTTAVVTEPGEVLAVPVARLHAVIGQDQGLGQWIIRTMFARRQWLMQMQTACGSSGRGPHRRPDACWSSPCGTGSRTSGWTPTPISRRASSSPTTTRR
jgi:CRP-like cAMP-binding protein